MDWLRMQRIDLDGRVPPVATPTSIDGSDGRARPIPTNDLWIAALVVEHSLVLCSRDHHFGHLPQLQLTGRFAAPDVSYPKCIDASLTLCDPSTASESCVGTVARQCLR